MTTTLHTEEATMSTTPTPQPPDQPAAHYKRPDWFTRNVMNKLMSGLTRLGVSVRGSRVLEHRGRDQRQAPPHPGQPPDDRGHPVPRRPPGRDPVGPQRAQRRTGTWS